MHQRGMQCSVCKHKAAHDLKKNDIAHTTFHYKYTNKEAEGLALC